MDLDAPAHDRAGAREGLTSGVTKFQGFAGAALPAVTSLTALSIAVSPHIGCQRKQPGPQPGTIFVTDCGPASPAAVSHQVGAL